MPLNRLLSCKEVRKPLAWWKEVFGRDFPAVHPFLSLCTGVAATTYPCPDNSSVALCIRETSDGYRAFPTNECADDYEDLVLEWPDVQAWRMDADKISDGLKCALRLDDSVVPPCPGLVYVGKCGRSGKPRQVYFCSSNSEPEVLDVLMALPQNHNIGCILFGVRTPALDAVLQDRPLGGTFLRESLSCQNGEWEGECSLSCVSGKRDISNQELQSRFDYRFDTIGKEFASVTAENDQLKKDLAASIASIAMNVEPEYFQWVFTILGAGSVSRAAKLLDIPNSSLTVKLKQYAAKGGVYATLFSMIKSRKGAGVKSIVGFVDDYADHQPADCSAPGHIHDLLDGLENLNADNWLGLRDELIELVKEELL